MVRLSFHNYSIILKVPEKIAAYKHHKNVISGGTKLFLSTILRATSERKMAESIINL